MNRGRRREEIFTEINDYKLLKNQLNMNYDDRTIKYLGGMVGSALGDAIGELAFHYSNRDELSMQSNRLKKLRYTDDTAMSIGLAESLIKKGWS